YGAIIRRLTLEVMWLQAPSTVSTCRHQSPPVVTICRGGLGGAPLRVPCLPPRTASPCPLRSLSPCSPSHHDLILALSRAPQRAIRLVTTLPPRRSQAHAGTPAAPCSLPPPPPV